LGPPESTLRLNTIPSLLRGRQADSGTQAHSRIRSLPWRALTPVNVVRRTSADNFSWQHWMFHQREENW